MNKYQEALYIIEQRYNTPKGFISKYSGISVDPIEAIPIIKELVDKETPKKLIRKPTRLCCGAFVEGWFCPKCNEELTITEYENERCHYCGQALDWE